MRRGRCKGRQGRGECELEREEGRRGGRKDVPLLVDLLENINVGNLRLVDRFRNIRSGLLVLNDSFASESVEHVRLLGLLAELHSSSLERRLGAHRWRLRSVQRSNRSEEPREERVSKVPSRARREHVGKEGRKGNEPRSSCRSLEPLLLDRSVPSSHSSSSSVA